MKNVNISETVTDRAISIEFLTHGVEEGYYAATRKISVFTTFGGHLGFLRKIKNLNISETVRDRAILIEFFKEYFVATQKIQIFSNFGGRVGFYRKTKNVNISETCGSPVSSRPWPLF